MPKFPTFPTLYDDCLQISISGLKRLQYLNEPSYKGGILNWKRNDVSTASIRIEVNTLCELPYIELDYKCNEALIKYRVQLVSIPSNLGNGIVWIFVCPHTKKRCRKLYLGDTYFYHRSTFRGCMYEKQTQSHSTRKLHKQFDKLQSADEAYEQIYTKHFKKYYRGKPTKRYLKLLKQIEGANGISEEALLSL